MTTLRFTSLALAASVMGAAVLAPAPAEAVSRCNSVSKVVTDIWAQFGTRIKQKACKSAQECLDNNEKKEQLVREMTAFWNSQSQSSWSTIGPRQLVFGGGSNDGKVVAGLSRLFTSPMPADQNYVEIIVTKQGGGGAKVSLSSYDNSACVSEVITFGRNDRAGTVKSVILANTKGKQVFVQVDADGTQSFDYKFAAHLKSNSRPTPR